MKSTGLFRKLGTLTLAGVLLLTSNPASFDLTSAETTAETKLIINEVYGGGGKTSKDGAVEAPFKNDFIELYNPTNEDVALNGFILTYTNSSGDTVQTYEFNEEHVIKANDYFLLRGEATIGNEGDKGFGEIFEADVYFEAPEAGIGMSDEKGNVELKKGESVIDAVSYGEPKIIKGEGSPISGLTFETSARRMAFADTNENSADFEAVKPSPTMSGKKEGDAALIEMMKISDIKSGENLSGKQITMEGIVTAGSIKTSEEAAMPVSYVQDSSGGIAAAGLDAKKGQRVRVTGTVQDVNGTRTLLTQETIVLDEKEADVPVLSVHAKDAAANEGFMVSVTGDITAKTENTLTIDNALTVYVDASIGSTKDYKTGDFISASGVIALNEQKQPILVLSSLGNIVLNEAKLPNTLELEKIAGFSTGVTDEEGGVAEIVKYNSENRKFYVINGKSQTIDIVSLNVLTSDKGQNLQKEQSINIAAAVNTAAFQYGDLTSIEINTNHKVITAAVQDADYTKQGKIVVMDYDGKILKTFDAGIQPDMVKMTDDGKYILSADEAEPREGLENGVDPEGSVTIVNYETGEVKKVKFNDASVIDNDVHIRNNGTKTDAVRDLEPEYIALSKDGSKAYVTLQENNAICAIDVAAGSVLSIKSLGYKDHSLTGNELDAARNGKIEIEQLPILGAYMPDSIAQMEMGGVSYLITANEGDATEWEEFENIAEFADVKDSITLDPSLLKGMSGEEADAALDKMKNSGDYDKLEVLTDRGTDAIYTLGGRSFSIWKADSMELVYDSGSDFEKITAQRYPEVFNWSNDDTAFEKRSAKKGPEPEDVKVGMIGNEVFAFVGLERIGGVMTYNITNPENSQLANYINTRDFSSVIAGDVAPEGLDFVPAQMSPTGRPLVLAGNEVSGTVAVNEVQVEPMKEIEGIKLDRTEASLEIGETIELKASIQPQDTTENKALTWTSSDEKTAKVSGDGVVTALAEGKAVITVQTHDGEHTAEALVTVNQPAAVHEEETEQEETIDEVDTVVEEIENSTNSNQDSDETASNTLPETATANYQYILWGLLLASAGGILYLNYRRRTSKE